MNPSATHSLRGRLLWFVLAAIFLAALLQAATAYRGALQQADAMFDEHLQQMARSLRSGIPLNSPLDEADSDDRFEVYVQIWGQDGTQIFRSTRSALPPRAVLGFSDVEAHGNRYRVYTLQTALQTVQIAQDLDARSARARALALRAVLPFVLLTPLLMLAVWWVISRSLAPIERARRQVAGRRPTICRRWPMPGCPTRCARWWTNSTCCLAACAAPSRRKGILWPTRRTSCARR
jgi:two-component system OmpR family sensor kinase